MEKKMKKREMISYSTIKKKSKRVNRRKIEQLIKRAESLREDGFECLVAIRDRDEVLTEGTHTWKTVFDRECENFMEKVAAITPLADLGEAGAEKEEEEEGISVMGDEAVDTLNYNDKRRLLSKIVNPYKKRDIWGFIKLSWWPKDIPCVEPSSKQKEIRQEDGKITYFSHNAETVATCLKAYYASLNPRVEKSKTTAIIPAITNQQQNPRQPTLKPCQKRQDATGTRMFICKGREFYLPESSWKSIEGTNWLDGEVIDVILGLIQLRDGMQSWEILSTDIWPRLCSSNTDLTSYQIFIGHSRCPHHGYPSLLLKWLSHVPRYDEALEGVLIPVNKNRNHWCLAALLPDQILMFDSLDSSLSIEDASKLYRLYRYVYNMDNVEEGTKPTITWKNVPQQQNTYDCGVYTIGFGEWILSKTKQEAYQRQVELDEKRFGRTWYDSRVLTRYATSMNSRHLLPKILADLEAAQKRIENT